MRARFLMLLILAGCEQQPSKLDVLPESDVESADLQTWAAIEGRALPMSIRNDLLQMAVAVSTRASTDERAAALVAWMDAGGSVPVATTMTAFESPGFEASSMRIIDLVRAKPEDDRIFEAALYAASKLRSDGVGFLAGAMAHFLTLKLAELRETAPPFAAKYAPTDAQVFRLFASEAMFARRATFEAEEQHNPGGAVELAMWREFANAPTERAAFLAFIDRTIKAHPRSVVGGLMRGHAEKMFAAVDNYQKWLGHR